MGGEDHFRSQQLEFPFDTARPSLDFVSTVGRRQEGGGYERLCKPADLGRWLVEAGLAERAPRVDEGGLRMARELREAVYRAITAAMDGKGAGQVDVQRINEAAAWPTLAPQLDAASGRLSWVSRRPLRAGLAAVARDALALLGGKGIERVKECAAPDCSLLFLDESRAGRRRWCSMERCGNRHKTAAYRRRRKAKGDAE